MYFLVPVLILTSFVLYSLGYSYDMRHILCPECNRSKSKCKGVADRDLEEILGPAFNARYMSISEPSDNPESKSTNGKRNPSEGLDFYVDSEFREVFDEEPAWATKNHIEVQMREGGGNARFKRDSNYKQEWKCSSKITWTDLGPDYFPRYLRSVECLSDSCWFNIYKCKPRSFTVKVLRRKPDRCAVAAVGKRVGTSGLPKELRELWVWEERAVSFCCDCSFA